MLNFEDIKRARNTIADHIFETPVLFNRSINDRLGANLFFKCENFQKTGSFKIRGAANAVFNLSEKELENGIITHSSGNHGAAVAQSAAWRNTKCYVVTPQNSPKVKKDSLARYGAEVTFSEATIDSRRKITRGIIDKTGATFIHPYDDNVVIAGAGTLAYALIDEIKDLDYIIVPIGGGGLISGTAIATKTLIPNCKIIGAEPQLADDAYQSFISGELQDQRTPVTVADGLRTSLVERTFKIILENVDDIVIVSEEEIISAMFLIWERMKIIVEPSSAVTLAVAAKIKKQLQGKRVGIILSGGNVDFKEVLSLL